MSDPARKLFDRLLDVVCETDLDNPCEDFLGIASAMLSLAISKMPAAKREEILQAMEDGALRRAVSQFPNAQPWATMTPECPNERRH